MRTLVIAETAAGAVAKASMHCITAAQNLATPIDVVILSDVAVDATGLQNLQGVEKIFTAVQANFAHAIAEELVPTIASIAKNYTHVIFPATSFGKNLVGRLGAVLDVQPITDVIKIITGDIFMRPIYAGNAIATVQSGDAIKVLSIRPTNFPMPQSGGAGAVVMEVVVTTAPNPKPVFVRAELSSSARPDLGAARIVISGGRGLGSAENFKLIERIADQLGAAIGASRAAVDAGFVPNDYQVGQTGKIVAPELYIAVGISGAIQHVAGMKDSKIIVAINKDAEAPIFGIADFGLVGDLFTLLPELSAAIAAVKSA
jgi:electron transfer flavoprotein alpha subunit